MRYRPAPEWRLFAALEAIAKERKIDTNEAVLAAAVKNQDMIAVGKLLQQKVDVNAVQPDGATALHCAGPSAGGAVTSS